MLWFADTRLYRGAADLLTIEFMLMSETRRREALPFVADVFEIKGVKWIRPLSSPLGRWLIDIDELKRWCGKDADRLSWASGRVIVSPELENVEAGSDGRERIETRVRFEFPNDDETDGQPMYFPELQPHIDRFQIDHPDAAKTAFVMMRFTDTDLQTKAFATVVETCKQFGITALRADDKTYADELLPNIRTYMHGCGFGIAIFERITTDDFNPNVSLEVGYMMALGKPVCLLKDSTLKSLHTDLVGRLYESFNPQNPETSLPARLTKWMQDKGIAPAGS